MSTKNTAQLPQISRWISTMDNKKLASRHIIQEEKHATASTRSRWCAPFPVRRTSTPFRSLLRGAEPRICAYHEAEVHVRGGLHTEQADNNISRMHQGTTKLQRDERATCGRKLISRTKRYEKSKERGETAQQGQQNKSATDSRNHRPLEKRAHPMSD